MKMRKRRKQGRNAVLMLSEHKRKRADELEADIDALFKLPLAEFTGARNELAARLKKSGRRDEAARVKALAKPSISAWAVNQLYWNHREEFDRLIASGERFHKAQTSRSAGKVADMREALDARREALTHLADLATSLLQAADHTPSVETIRRITTTLEGLSAYASRSDGPRPGRLTNDVDPPGFESLAGFSSGAGMERQEADGGRQVAGTPSRVTSSRKSSSGAASKRNDDVRQLAETRKANIANAKVSLQDAKRSLTEARARAQSLEAAQKKAEAEAKKTEKQRREAEDELRKAKAASEDAARRARSVTVEVKEAAKAVEDAELTVEEAAKELESLLRES
jgi:hypothetical protein